MKTTWTVPLAFCALAAFHACHAADRTYRSQVARMTCGDASYVLTSSCINSGDLTTLNDCKSQSLFVKAGGTRRSTTLPEFSKGLNAQIRASRGDLEELFVVKWACSCTSNGAMATLHYSIGGGSAEYSEAWSHYDKAGRLIQDTEKLTRDEVRAVQHNFKKVPSIMPELAPWRQVHDQ